MPTTRWTLEVVRGREVGRRFSLPAGTLTLGNAPGHSASLDLSTIEPVSPRRMAAQQAELVVPADPAQPPSVRDLDSPGGTFVNRQRLLAGQLRRLEPDDVVQLGGVQLRVVAPASDVSPDRPATPTVSRPSPPSTHPPISNPTANATATPPPSSLLPTPFRLVGGTICRTWDDFLTLSAQSWAALREELGSGRLGAYLARNGLESLKPSLSADRSLDEHLDAWLGRLPTTRRASPQLDVHPEVVRIRAVPGGGVTRARIVLINTGYRLLRCTLRVDRSADPLLSIPAHVAGELVTTDETEVLVDVTIPETVERPLVAGLIVDGNGGSRRIEIRVEPAAKNVSIPEGVAELESSSGSLPLLRQMTSRRRMAIGAMVGLLGWAVIMLGDQMAALAGQVGAERPGVGGPLLLAGLLGAFGGLGWARRSGGKEDWIPCSLTGAMAAALAIATWVAILRSCGTLGAGVVGSGLVSLGLGLLLAWSSTRLAPHELPATSPSGAER